MIIKKIKPMFTAILTTMKKYAVDEVSNSGLITDTSKLAGTIKEFQTVVAVGDQVRGIKVGDLVCIDPSHYAVKKFQENSMKNDLMENQNVGYRFNVIELEGVPHLLLQNNDIVYVVEEWEEDQKWDAALVMPDSSILT